MQTVERCERWAQDCVIGRRRSWWQRGVPSTSSPSSPSFSSSMREEKDGCGGCKAAKELQACPKYMEELNLALFSTTPVVPPMASTVGATAARPRGILSRWPRRHEDPGGDPASAPCPAVLRAIRVALSRAWCKVSAPTKHLLSFGGKVVRGVRRAVGRAPSIGRKGGTNNVGAGRDRGGCRDSDSADGLSRRAYKLRKLYPAFIYIPHQHSKIRAAQRALGRPHQGTVPLAIGLNGFVVGMLGIGVYAIKKRRRSELRQERPPGRERPGRGRREERARCEGAAPRTRRDTVGTVVVARRVSVRSPAFARLRFVWGAGREFFVSKTRSRESCEE